MKTISPSKVRRSTLRRAGVLLLPVLALAPSCGAIDGGEKPTETQAVAGALTSCSSASVKIADLHADFRDIWKGLETPQTGKEADSNLSVGIDFSATVQPAQVSGQFMPLQAGGACGAAVPTVLAGSVIAAQTWGTATSNAGRPAVPAPYNVFARDSITGVVSAGGAIAAGGDIAISNFGLNATTRQAVGLVAGGAANLSSGSIVGNVSYGKVSTIPVTVTVSGTKSLLPYAVADSFRDLTALSVMLAGQAPTGTVTSSNGALQLTGTKAGVNVFRVTADALSAATSLGVSVPTGASALVNITGRTAVTLQNKGLSLQGVTASTLLWNIPSAPYVQIASISLVGSMLAPTALVTFESGGFNGTLVAASFSSPGSGTLQYSALNVAKLFGEATPSQVRLGPAQPLIGGCTYRFSLPANVPLTSGNACLSPPLSVDFRVARSAAPPAGRELISAEADPVLHTLRRFSARVGVNTLVDDVWERYGSAIGAVTLVPTTTSAPSSTRAGQTVTVYQQVHQGYPVVGHGYFVAAQGNLFRAANGKLMPGLPRFPTPAVTSAAALQSALAFLKINSGQAPWIVKPNLYRAPVGRLVVTPKRIGGKAADFALAWEFRFGTGTGIGRAAGIQVDASTGAVLASDAAFMGLTILDPLATYVSQGNATVDTIYDGAGKALSVASYRQPDQSMASTLASDNITANGVHATVIGVDIDDTGSLVGLAQYVVDPTSATPWTSTEPVEQRMASAQWALQLSGAFVKTLNLQVAGSAWQAIDGPAAVQKVFVDYSNGPPIVPIPPAVFSQLVSSASAAHILLHNDGLVRPVQASTVAHEYGHALVHNLRRVAGLPGPVGFGSLATYDETGAINEGIADLFAIALNHKLISPSGDWACIMVDFGTGPQCYRNIAEPLLSKADPLRNGRPGHPILYKDTPARFYGNYAGTPMVDCTAANDNCGVHLNSTIISHWGYLLAAGSSGSATVPCGLTIAPLDANLDESMRIVLNIALKAIGTRIGPASTGLGAYATFADFRDATLQIAEEMVNENTLPADALLKLELAWAAVGLPASVTHSTIASPANSSGVNPWASFQWASNGEGQAATEWDFQLANGATFDTNFKFQRESIVDEIAPGITVLPLALPEKSADNYFWRVRPHSALPWETCYPIHSFSGTTEPDPVKNLRVVSDLDDAGTLVLPGQFYSAWDAVHGTVPPSYDIYLSTTDAQCTDGPDVARFPAGTGALEPDRVTWRQFSGVITQPKSHYFMGVRPLGPPDVTGAPTEGKCFTLEFDTAQLRPPVTEDIPRGQVYSQPWFQGFRWTVTGGAVKSLVSLYERDENGDCAGEPVVPPFEVESTCLGSCDAYVATPHFPSAPNPTGYCWSVVTEAENGEQSEPSETKYIIFSAFTLNPSPGAWFGDVFSGEQVGALGNASYGKEVAFSWTTTPNFPSAPRYEIKLGRWPWSWFGPRSSPDPANCVSSTPRANNTCFLDPMDLTTLVRKRVDGSETTTLSAAEAGKGRYCWTSWPVFDDPDREGTRREPDVQMQLQCYTTGPDKPTIEVPTVYTPTKAFVKLKFNYVPDAQATLEVSSPGGSSITAAIGDVCPTVGPQFKDVYACEIPVTINVADPGGQSVHVELKTWNSDKWPAVRDDASLVHDEIKDFTMPTCGERAEVCCGDPSGPRFKPCNSAQDTHCNKSNKCEACGSEGQPCCTTNGTWCNGNDLGCDEGTCRKCGADRVCCYQQAEQCPQDYTCVQETGETSRCRRGGATCSTPLVAPSLPQPPLDLEGAAGCSNIADLEARVACIKAGGPASDLCQYFAPSITCGVGWPAVNGADHYNMKVYSLGLVTPIRVPGSSGQIQQIMPIGILPLAGTVEACGRRGFGVIVTAVDACGNEGPASVTGISCAQ